MKKSNDSTDTKDETVDSDSNEVTENVEDTEAAYAPVSDEVANDDATAEDSSEEDKTEE